MVTEYTAWNTANVTNMQGVFAEALSFNGDITEWRTDGATTVAYMFAVAISFNQNIAMDGLGDGSDESYWYITM